MLGKLIIPLAHTGKDAANANEVFGTPLGKLYMNPGKVAVPCSFSPFTGTAPNLKTTCTAASVDFVAGVNTFEVTPLDAAGNEGPSLVVNAVQSVDNKAPGAFTADGAAVFTPL